MLLLDLHDRVPLPTWPGNQLSSKMLEGIRETLSYNFLLDSTEHAFEHCRILPMPTLGLPLPFRQSYERWDLCQLECDGLRALTC